MTDTTEGREQPKHSPLKIGCCCCCVLFVVLAIAIGSIAASFQKPTVSVAWVKLTDMGATANTAYVKMNVALSVNNPNGWPVKVTVNALDAEVYSINKHYTSTEDRGDVYVGNASLPGPVAVDVHSKVDFTLHVTANLGADTAMKATPRWLSECGPTNIKKTTNLLVRVQKLVAKAIFPVTISGAELETEVSCDMFSYAADAIPTGLPNVQIPTNAPVVPALLKTTGTTTSAAAGPGANGGVLGSTTPKVLHMAFSADGATGGPHSMRRAQLARMAARLQP